MSEVRVVFKKLPSEELLFVDVRDDRDASIPFLEWRERDDGDSELVINTGATEAEREWAKNAHEYLRLYFRLPRTMAEVQRMNELAPLVDTVL